MEYFGLHPFWFWNGPINKDELKKQIHQMADKGISGFFIHPRQGLSIPYLSNTYFNLIEFAIREAAKRGLAVHLYDEFPYPSGVAGGQVVLGNPEYLGTHLIQKEYFLSEGSIKLELPKGKILNSTLFPMENKQILWDQAKDVKTDIGILFQENTYHETGLTSYNRKRYLACEPCPHLIINLPEGDYLLSVSVQAITETHKYWGYYFDPLNKKAVKEFIDLTHRQYKKHCGDQFGQHVHSIFTDEVKPDWSSLLPESFEQYYGYNLLNKLPALHQENHPEHYTVKNDFQTLLKKLFIESFEKPVSAWCKENNLKYCGEKAVFNLSQLSFMDIPGCEPGHTKAGAMPDLLGDSIRQNAKAVSSAAYFYNKKDSLCECYHSLGWGGTLLDARIILEGLALLGVTMMVPHGFFYSTHGLKKHDAPPSFFFQMPFWPLMKCLSERLKNIGDLFAGTRINAQILIYEITESFPGKKEQEVFNCLQHLLMENHLDFLLADCSILETTSEDFKVLVIPPLKYIDEKLETTIEKWKEKGVFIYKVNHDFNEREFLKTLTQLCPPSLSFKLVGEAPERLWMVSRINKSGHKSWFFLNTENKELEIHFDPRSSLKEETLDHLSPLALINNTRLIRPFESFYISESQEFKNNQDSQTNFLTSITIAPLVRVKNQEKNLHRLGEWNLSIIDDNQKISEIHKVQPKPLINQLSDGGFKFMPHFTDGFGCSPQLSLPEMYVCYDTMFKCDYSEKVELLMEPESLLGDWSISLNNKRRITAYDFHETQSHVKGTLGVDITDSICQGINIVNIKLKTSKNDHGLLCPLYLAGDFGVYNNGLTKRPKEGGFENYVQNGLPFYSGIIQYEYDLELSANETEKTLIELKAPSEFQEAVSLSINDSDFFHMPWIPYQTLIPSKTIKQGKNKIRLKVYTSLSRSFDASHFCVQSHKYKKLSV